MTANLDRIKSEKFQSKVVSIKTKQQTKAMNALSLFDRGHF